MGKDCPPFRITGTPNHVSEFFGAVDVRLRIVRGRTASAGAAISVLILILVFAWLRSRSEEERSPTPKSAEAEYLLSFGRELCNSVRSSLESLPSHDRRTVEKGLRNLEIALEALEKAVGSPAERVAAEHVVAVLRETTSGDIPKTEGLGEHK